MPGVAPRGVAPSILSADFARLAAQVEEVMAAGARVIHCDVMDGHFVPPITFGPMVVSALREALPAEALLDVHLMIERPERHVAAFVDAGADHVTFHVEATPHVDYTLNLIREAGATAGVALNPGTAVDGSASRSAPTTLGPNVIGGTKCPSMTSQWMTRAPASMTSSTWAASREKSADRIDGATPRTASNLRSCCSA